MTWAQYQKELTAFRRLVATILEEEYPEHSWSEVFKLIAHKTGMCKATVERLMHGETKDPRTYTIQRICHFVGLPQLGQGWTDAKPPTRRAA